MRIIGGVVKGRPIRAPKSRNTRPTLSRVRAAVFDILGSKVLGASFLDLFAGSGSVGLEALSRGAQQVLFVEVQPENCALIRANLRNLGFEEGARIWCADARRALKRLARSGEKFDVVFADPPYGKNWLSLLGETLKVAQVLPPGGICLVQVARRDPVIDRFGSLILEREYSYGDTKLLLYYWTDDAQGGEKEFGQQRTNGNNAVDGETGAVSQPGDENSVYRQGDSEGAAGF